MTCILFFTSKQSIGKTIHGGGIIFLQNIEHLSGSAIVLLVFFTSIACADYGTGVAVCVRHGVVQNIVGGVSLGPQKGQLWKYDFVDGIRTSKVKLYDGPCSFARLSPDGKMVAFVKSLSAMANSSDSLSAFGPGKVCVMSIDGGAVTELANCEELSLLDFPDTSWVYFSDRTPDSHGGASPAGHNWKRVNVSTNAIIDVASFHVATGQPMYVYQFQKSRVDDHCVVRTSVDDYNPNSFYHMAVKYDIGTGNGLLSESFGGRWMCITGMFADGVNAFLGWNTHDGWDIQDWNTKAVVTTVSNTEALGWPPRSGTGTSPGTSEIFAVFASRAATNNPEWILNLTGRCLWWDTNNAFLLINYIRKYCINITEGTAEDGLIGGGDAWIKLPDSSTAIVSRQTGLPGEGVSSEATGFHSVFTFKYSLQKDACVKISVFTSNGQIVKTIYDGWKRKGTHSVAWNGTDISGHRVTPGVYLIADKNQVTGLRTGFMVIKR